LFDVSLGNLMHISPVVSKCDIEMFRKCLYKRNLLLSVKRLHEHIFNSEQ